MTNWTMRDLEYWDDRIREQVAEEHESAN